MFSKAFSLRASTPIVIFLCSSLFIRSAVAQTCSPFGQLFSGNSLSGEAQSVLTKNARLQKELSKVQAQSANRTARATRILRAEWDSLKIFEDRAKNVPALCFEDPKPGDEVMSPEPARGPLLDLPTIPGVNGPGDLFSGPILGIAEATSDGTILVRRAVIYKDRWFGCKNKELDGLKAKLVTAQSRVTKAQKRFQTIDYKEQLAIQRVLRRYKIPTAENSAGGPLWKTFLRERVAYIKCLLMGGL